MQPLFSKRYKHIGRYREIVNILTRHGLGHLLEFSGLGSGVRFLRRKRDRGEALLGMAKRIRIVLEELGPTFIKLGQILSTRPDLLPPVYIEQLERLQDNVVPVAFDEIKETIEREVELPLNKIFSYINEKPIASASIGQVHEGYLLSGEHVVVKVQRAGVDLVVETDLEIMYDMARLLEARTTWGRFYKLVSMVDEFSRSIREELNYIIEARNAQRLWDNFREDPEVKIPRVFWEFTTRKVLFLEYVDGIKVTADNELDAAGIDKPGTARKIADAVLRQLLIHGFFHADPHPGNIAVTHDHEIVFMDFGMVGRLDEWMKSRLGTMLISIIRKDVDGIVRVLIDIGEPQQKVDRQKLKRDIYRLFDKYYDRPLHEIKIGQALRELLGMSFVYKIRVPVELVLMIRALILLEAIVERLDPEISIFEVAEPFGKILLKEKLAPRRLAQAALDYLFEFTNITLKLPRHLDNLVQTLEEGDFKVTLEHRNFNKLIARLNLVGNRISFSLIVASIIIGSSLITQRSPHSILWRFPIAEAGFVIAVFMGIWLLISIIRSGRI